jgi:hypothetical protein
VRYAALIIAGEQAIGEKFPLLFRLGGQSLLERLINQLAAAEVGHIVLLVGALPAEIVTTIDRLSGKGLSIDLARTAADAADRIHPDETVIVVEGGLILPDTLFSEIRNTAGALLVTVPARTDTAGFERIDAKDHWLGLAQIEGAELRGLAGRLGDWSFGPTLLRLMVQKGAARLEFGATDQDYSAVRPETAAALSKAERDLRSNVKLRNQGWFESFLNRVGTLPLLAFLAKINITSKVLNIVSIILIFIAFIFAILFYPGVGALLFAAASLPILLSRALASMTARQGGDEKTLDRLRDAGFLIFPAFVGFSRPVDGHFGVGLCLALWLIVQWALLRHADWIANPPRRFRNDCAGLALILGLSAFADLSIWGLGLCIGLLVAEQFLRQRRLPSP